MKSYVTDMIETEYGIEARSPGYVGALTLEAHEDIDRYDAKIPPIKTSVFSSTVCIVEITDPRGHKFNLRKTYGSFKEFHGQIKSEYNRKGKSLELPPLLKTQSLELPRSKYLLDVLDPSILPQINPGNPSGAMNML